MPTTTYAAFAAGGVLGIVLGWLGTRWAFRQRATEIRRLHGEATRVLCLASHFAGGADARVRLAVSDQDTSLQKLARLPRDTGAKP